MLWLRHILPVRTSVSLCDFPCAWNNSASTGRTFVKFHIWVFFENLSRNFQIHYKLTRVTGTLYESLCTFMIKYRWILLRMRTVSDKNWTENQNTHFIFNTLFSPENYTVYETMWRNVVEPDATEENIIRGMHSAWWITMATHTISVYIMLIDFQWQTFLLGGACILIW
jgi:hypothetical protein